RAACVTGHGHVLRLMKRFDEAMSVLRQGKKRFPFDSAIVSEIAKVYSDQGRMAEALETYNTALADFPLDSYITNGRANLHKALRKYDEALRIYDENTARFPYDVISWSGRADLLKQLGQLGPALDAYDRIISRWPTELGPKHSKAAVLVALGHFDKADELLPLGQPNTLDEWIAYHVRGMIFLRSGQIEEAVAHFSSGLQRVPYLREKRYFERALAVAFLSKREFLSVPSLVLDSEEPVANVLRLHAFAAMGERVHALNAMKIINANAYPNVISLSAEIAKRYGLSMEQPEHDENWIFQREIEVVLLEAA
ncbi:MAG: tetratricopeptide repeat protein, partial [Betaproteobacteria bacterium]